METPRTPSTSGTLPVTPVKVAGRGSKPPSTGGRFFSRVKMMQFPLQSDTFTGTGKKNVIKNFVPVKKCVVKYIFGKFCRKRKSKKTIGKTFSKRVEKAPIFWDIMSTVKQKLSRESFPSGGNAPPRLHRIPQTRLLHPPTNQTITPLPTRCLVQKPTMPNIE